MVYFRGRFSIAFLDRLCKIGNSAVSGSFTNVSRCGPTRIPISSWKSLRWQAHSILLLPQELSNIESWRVIGLTSTSSMIILPKWHLAENPKITIYKGQLVYGTEPSSTNSSSMMTMSFSTKGQSEKLSRQVRWFIRTLLLEALLLRWMVIEGPVRWKSRSIIRWTNRGTYSGERIGSFR